ncbi:MMPL family transporter [Candidatus Woesearchaeota archaeon]|nr:MMPL family transporter [Candidatus Woesearchaeota archaeon]
MIEKFSDFVQKRPKTIIAVILLITVLFFIPLSKLEVDTSPKHFTPGFILEPYERLESKINLPFHHVYITGKNNESVLSLNALKEQLELINFLHKNFDVETKSMAELIEKELKKHNKSIKDIKTEEELGNAMYYVFRESPKDFKKTAQAMLAKDYDITGMEKLHLVQEFYPIVSVYTLFNPLNVKLPYTKITRFSVIMKNIDSTEREREQYSITIRESADNLSMEHIRASHYSYFLVAYDFDQKLGSNTLLLVILTIISMSAIIFLSFRRLYFVFIPFLIMTVAVIWTFGTAVLLNLRITAMHTFVIALLVGIALDDPLHITKRFVEQRGKNNFAKSLKTTLSSMMPAIFLTSLTTAGAFAAQLILPAPPAFLSFAIVVIIGVTYSFILVCLLWPALTMVKSHLPVINLGHIVRKAMNRAYYIGMKHSKIIITILIAGLLISIFNIGNIETNVSVDMYVPEGAPSKEAIKLDNLYSNPYAIQFILIEGNILQPEILLALDKLEENMQDNENFEKVDKRVIFESINTLLRQVGISNTTDLKTTFDGLYENNDIADPITKQTVADKAKLILHKNGSNYTSMLVVFYTTYGKIEKVKQAYDELMKDIEKSRLNEIEGNNVEITGVVFSVVRSELFVRKIQVVSSILMFIFTFIILLIIYRKLSLSTIVSIPILFGSFFSLGLMSLLKIPLTWISTTVIPLVIGLGIDYSIHLAERYKEELKKHNRKEAIRIALEQTGEGNWLAAVSTAVGFLIISFSVMPMAKSFGILTAISIALTFLTTIFLLPALLVKFVKK